MNNLQVITAQPITVNHFTKYVDWIDRGKETEKTYLKDLSRFYAYLKYSNIEKPIREDIINYRDWLLQEHPSIKFDSDNIEGWSFRLSSSGDTIQVTCKPSTVQQYLRVVKSFFKWTDSEGLYPNIAINIHTPKVNNTEHKRDCLRAEEINNIENSMAKQAQNKITAIQGEYKDTEGKEHRAKEQYKRLKAIYLLTVTTGLRVCEVSRANIKDFETKGNQSYIYIQGKGHSEADTRKPIAREVAEAIQDYLNSRIDKYNKNSPLFVATGNRSGGKRLAPTTISSLLKTAMIKAGYDSERLTAHSLRHTTGTTIQGLTSDLLVTQRYMRHQNPATTEIYLHTSTEEKEAELSQKIYNLYHGKDTDSDREKLLFLIGNMTETEVSKLLKMAEAMRD